MIAGATFAFVLGVKIAETIDAGGTAAQPIAHARVDFQSDEFGNATFSLPAVIGTIAEIMARPDSDIPPSSGWDVVVKDSTGRIVWTGTNLSTSAETRVTPALAIANELTFLFSSMGNAKRARLAIWVA